ncbi:hypothetical protein ACLOJK_022813 [Asimina triloba]
MLGPDFGAAIQMEVVLDMPMGWPDELLGYKNRDLGGRTSCWVTGEGALLSPHGRSLDAGFGEDGCRFKLPLVGSESSATAVCDGRPGSAGRRLIGGGLNDGSMGKLEHRIAVLRRCTKIRVYAVVVSPEIITTTNTGVAKEKNERKKKKIGKQLTKEKGIQKKF